ncbi:hypothetical protein Ahy_B02g060131 [Arachis hypogaea]|uniref:Uncharacterized protein n=1 Tax=Arachis hypogaea TaxID=3818 RepID=A0A445AHV4_ARAHY|nr:hypothetical protein Ahy_B02g060131 [Arachis hypogaea]
MIHNVMIKNIFNHQMARRLQQMMEDVRERRDHLTIWSCLDIKKALYIHWETDEEFRHHSLSNRANKASLGRQSISVG